MGSSFQTEWEEVDVEHVEVAAAERASVAGMIPSAGVAWPRTLCYRGGDCVVVCKGHRGDSLGVVLSTHSFCFNVGSLRGFSTTIRVWCAVGCCDTVLTLLSFLSRGLSYLACVEVPIRPV